MKKYYGYLVCFLLIAIINTGTSQIKSGPMVGYTELRTSQVWLQFERTQNLDEIQYSIEEKGENPFGFKANSKPEIEINYLDKERKIVLLKFSNLIPSQTYTYNIKFNQTEITPATISGDFTTLELWHFRRTPPDFSFITGSCNYVNDPPYDRPGRPYGQDSSIFTPMAQESAKFMLWLGDNWYTREIDYFSPWGLQNRAEHDRAVPELQPLLKAMPQFAAWDDHDYGPNDGDKSFIFRQESREVFKKYWANPSYGENQQGIYSQFVWNDVAFFLLDDRTFRSNDELKDSIKGKPNSAKKMLGETQMEWLKNALVQANSFFGISFKIIVLGSQVLNPVSPYNSFYHYPSELDELKEFIAQENIKGVIFLTGDRHHSEIIKIDRENNYPLYDITVSPLTSGTHTISGVEVNNPYRVMLLDKIQNYAVFNFSGDYKNRVLNVSFKDKKGEVVKTWSVPYNSLRKPK
ncbi:MAG: alkaline phosphatase D family protein [Sediminibacterium sp.]|nr:alkaline phosphatase D family protein [Sediminibacterium sp.]